MFNCFTRPGITLHARLLDFHSHCTACYVSVLQSGMEGLQTQRLSRSNIHLSHVMLLFILSRSKRHTKCSHVLARCETQDSELTVFTIMGNIIFDYSAARIRHIT